MTSFKIEVADKAVSTALADLDSRVKNPNPVLRAIGESWLRLTKRTFETSTDPWGRRWKPNTRLTIERMLDKSSGNFGKGGKISAKGSGRVMGKKPLIGESRYLSGSSLHLVPGNNEMTLGSSAIYAAIQNQGAKAGEFGRYYQLSRLTKYGEGDFRRYAGMRQGHPLPWGDIPARPFMVVDSAGNVAPGARDEAVGIIEEYLESR